MIVNTYLTLKIHEKEKYLKKKLNNNRRILLHYTLGIVITSITFHGKWEKRCLCGQI